MQTLNISGSGTGATANLPRTSVPKSPGLAFLLSLFVPGLGQLYCGEKRRGLWTFFLFVGCAALVVALAGSSAEDGTQFLGIGLRTGLVLYMFSFLDAFYTAREMRDGTHALLQYNPRVAAVLNLVTRGFGYWYLDEKKKGVLLFFLVGAAGRIAMTSHNQSVSAPLEIFVEVALAAMAVDAYRIANRNNARWLLQAESQPLPPQPESVLKPAVPVALAALMALGYAGLVTIGLLMPEEESIDQTRASIAKLENGSVYSNSKYNVELRVPADWAIEKGEQDQFAKANTLGGICSVIMTRFPGLPIIATRSLPKAMLTELRKNQPGFNLVEVRPSSLGGKPAHTIVFSVKIEETEVRQNYVYVQDGFWIVALVETIAEPSGLACEKDLQVIRDSAVFQ